MANVISNAISVAKSKLFRTTERGIAEAGISGSVAKDISTMKTVEAAPGYKGGGFRSGLPVAEDVAIKTYERPAKAIINSDTKVPSGVLELNPNAVNMQGPLPLPTHSASPLSEESSKWWNKNKKAVGIGAGVAAGGLLLGNILSGNSNKRRY